jgi:hypothetical protein
LRETEGTGTARTPMPAWRSIAAAAMGVHGRLWEFAPQKRLFMGGADALWTIVGDFFLLIQMFSCFRGEFSPDACG